MKRILACIAIALALVLSGCASSTNGATNNVPDTSEHTDDSGNVATAQASIAHRYASVSEGKELLLSNDEYYAGFSQNDLDFRMQKKGATLDELKAFAAEQVLDFTDEEKALIDDCLAKMAGSLEEHGYTLPPLDEIVFVKTTMAEEYGAGGYTHGTAIFVPKDMLEALVFMGEEMGTNSILTKLLWHETFHCLTRCNPDFRASMYEIINFSVHDADFPLPASAREYHISNPDVEHHDSSAVFSIDGKDVECFCDFVTTRHFEKVGDSFFDFCTTALVPVDGTDAYYTPEAERQGRQSPCPSASREPSRASVARYRTQATARKPSCSRHCSAGWRQRPRERRPPTQPLLPVLLDGKDASHVRQGHIGLVLE